MQVEIEDLFKVSLYRAHFDIDTTPMLNILGDLHKEGKLKSQEGWKSGILTSHSAFNPNLQYPELIKRIASHVYDYATQMGYKVNQVACKESWFNYGLKHSYQEYHIHAHCHITGVYYIETPKDSGDIVFRTNKNMYPIELEVDNNIYTARTRSITPQKGNLILFPADVEHMVEMNKTDNPRISLSFNFIIE